MFVSNNRPVRPIEHVSVLYKPLLTSVHCLQDKSSEDMSSLVVIAVFFGVFGGELKFILVLFSQKERKIIYKIRSRTFEYVFFS